MTDAIRELFELLAKKENTGSDYTGTVTRVEGNTAFVRFSGSDIDDTPVSLSIGAKEGDTVRVRVADGRAWLVGNDTAPPNDSSGVAYDLIRTNAYIRELTTENIRGENGWINLLNGTFDYGNGALSWNGDHLTVKGAITATSGKIGPWDIGATAIYKGSSTWGASTSGAAYFGDDGISITDKFKVNASGALTATGATISGTLTAGANSKIGPWTVASSSIYYGNSAYGNAGGLYFGTSGLSLTDKFMVSAAGALTCTGADITGVITATSGKLGNWTLSAHQIVATANNANTGNVDRTTGLQWPGNGIWAIAVGATNAASWATAPFRVNHKGEMYAASGTIGPWTLNSSGLSATVSSVTTQIYPNYIYLGSSSNNCNMTSEDFSLANASSTMMMRPANLNFTASSGQVQINLTANASPGRSGRLVATSTNFGLYDITAKEWVLRSGNDDNVYVPHKFYCYGVEDTTGRMPVQSNVAEAGLVSVLSANSTALAVRGRWGSTTTFSAKNFTPASSDIRIKSDINKSKIHALDLIRQIDICEFKKEGVYQPIGMIADWIEELDPLLTVGGGYDDNGAMNIKSVDTFYLMGYVVKAIQELENRLAKVGG
jgi:hypothetical protein